MFHTVNNLKYTNIINAFKSVIKEEGYLGLFRGNGVNLLRIVPNSAIKFSSFDLYKMITDKSFPESKSAFAVAIRSFLAGSLSGATQVLITYPLDVTKSRIMLAPQYKGIYLVLKSSKTKRNY